MQGRDKNRPKSQAEELLEDAFDACMEEQMSFIPPESEIARMHTFSEGFQKAMEQLLRTKGKPERRNISRKEFVYGFNKVAAGILLLFVAGSICAGGMMLLSRSGAKQSAAPAEAPVETSEPAAADSLENGMAEETAEEETVSGSADGTEPGDPAAGAFPDEMIFAGGTVELAEVQELSCEWEGLKTLVNSPVIARDAESFKVTVGNMEEYSISYDAAVALEVWLEGAWYQVPIRQERPERQRNVTLEPGMAQDEEIFLEDYDWDYEAEKYRVVTRLELPVRNSGPMELLLGSEFRFENPEEDLEEALRAEGE